MDIEKKIYLVLKKLGARPECAVAKVFNTKPTCVERTIRYCIADIREHTPVEVLNEILGENTSSVTNSNFIGRVYEYLKYEGDELEVTEQ